MKKKIDKQGKLNSPVLRILLIENNPDDVRLIQWIISGIRKSQFKLECVDRLKKALKRLAKGGIDGQCSGNKRRCTGLLDQRTGGQQLVKAHLDVCDPNANRQKKHYGRVRNGSAPL